MHLYPLKFTPITQYRIWGGNKLNSAVPQHLRMENLGEIWSISGIDNNISLIENGELKGKNIKEVLNLYGERIVGKEVWNKYGDDFPILVKFIDAAEDLSIQVHPDDLQAKVLHNSFGKSEMWYVMDAKSDAKLTIGFKEGVTLEDYKQYLSKGHLESILNQIPAQKGDAVYVPAGRVHAIGAGVTLAEIQQTSDITYRIYDYKRLDKDGKERELHTDLAQSAIDFTPIEQIKANYDSTKNQFNSLIDTPYFKTKIFDGEKNISIQNSKQMHIYICASGNVEFQTEENNTSLSAYQSLLMPAEISDFHIKPKGRASLIEVTIP